ncbi:hypothetical protein MVEG_12342 [Podila verticillata NRRL 6337]|uniref:F-box domain-containing protein n=1 Tax=Podila verticillata NRRL 6337 TaxID=1069443 RepID=A0A086TIQ6_9FUNG|nr:hypothetical protein MVEG_12342 [Podila verticillata NRRL 6337]
MDALPTELLLSIINLVAKDQFNLASCTQINKRWHLLTRQRLYSAPRLNRLPALTAFLKTVSGPHMVHYLSLTKETNRERHHSAIQHASFSLSSSLVNISSSSAPSSTAATTTLEPQAPFLSSLMPLGGLVDTINLSMLPHRWETVNAQHIQDLVLGCPWISRLDIQNCSQLRDNAVQLIAENLGPRHLRSLVLSGCSRITDLAILSLCAHATELENLELSGCDRISDVSIWELGTATITLQVPPSPALSSPFLSSDSRELESTITRGVSRTLKSLDLSHCTRITEAGVRALRAGMGQLSSLNLEGCYGVLLNDDNLVTNEWEDIDDDFQDDSFDTDMENDVAL